MSTFLKNNKKLLYTFLFCILFLPIVLRSKRKVFTNFHTKIFILRSFWIFWKRKLWRARVGKFADCWNWTNKNIPDRQQSAHFRESQKVIYHSTLLHTVHYDSRILSYVQTFPFYLFVLYSVMCLFIHFPGVLWLQRINNDDIFEHIALDE